MSPFSFCAQVLAPRNSRSDTSLQSVTPRDTLRVCGGTLLPWVREFNTQNKKTSLAQGL